MTGAGALAALVAGCARRQPPDPRWAAYKTRFFQPEGRIVDTGNGGVSHSEGQGYGLLLAASMENEHVRRPKKRCPREGGSAHAARM